ncbi:MAG: carboxypeptidase regulatory-like domain-containing protein [Hymenobacteraceae bacterium]|nr:carboxypeptidase regulatory-like domain-containing protein [Hymenobacteraceae bacterium]
MATYPMAQGDLYLLLPQAWGAYTEHQAVFGKYKKTKYSLTLATEALERLDAAMKLPSQQARGAMPESTRVELVQQRDEFLDQWNLLDGYVEDAYRATGNYKAMREAAGLKLYAAAANGDWGAAAELVNQALAFVTTNLDALKTKGGMDDAFVATLTAEGDDVRRVVRRYLKQQEDAESGTDAKTKANEACFAEFQQMSADAQRLFRRQPEIAVRFQAQALLERVRGTRQAGIRGVVTDANGQDVIGATVTVKEKPDVLAVTDEDGRYFIALASGTYTVVVNGKKEVPGVVVEVGVKKRVDVEV